MEIVTGVISIVSCLWGSTNLPKCYIDNLRENVDLLKEAMDDLKSIRDDVKSKVDPAEKNFLKRTYQVQRWLEKVETRERQVNAMEVEFRQMARCFGGCRPNFWSGYKLGKRVTKKLKDVSELQSKGESFSEVAYKPLGLPDPIEEMPSTSAVSRDLVLEKVLNWIGEGKRVIGIYGMGGVGKTTLLNDINDQFLKRNVDFDVVIWVVVSKELNVRKIQMDIGKRLGLSWAGKKSYSETRAHGETRAHDEKWAQDIRNVLSSKKFMLLLDDIWEQLDLDKVGIPHPSSRSKVVFTTRLKYVCGHMAADENIEVECLLEQEAMNLFLRNVGEGAMKSHPQIPDLANSVAKECKGLPLALITIGRAMACKKTPQEWKHAISVLSTSMLSEISGINDEMLLRLKFSYDNLRGDAIKLCLLYCTLFPEDYSIDKEELIDYWIGVGCLDGWDDDFDKAHKKGRDIIGSLKAACLLESGSDEQRQVKLHDMIRDMALGITSKCPNPLTLMLQRNWYFTKFHTHFFQFMPLLRVLDLSYNFSLKELPAAIGYLLELRYLNLSCTEITSLPEEIGNLVKLMHLDLQYTISLYTIPQRVISRLSKLRVLKLFRSYSKWEEECEGLNLSELESLERLSHLNLTLSNARALEMLLCSSKLRNVTRYLQLNRCKDLTISNKLSSLFTAMKSLQRLSFHDCNGLVEVTIGADVKKDEDYPVSSLEWLELYDFSHLNCIRVGRGCFRNLRTITISSCHKLKRIDGLLQLESLEEILIDGCYELEEVIGTAINDDEVGDAGLMQLKRIRLWNLFELTSICSYALHFPSLEELYVINCPKLKKLPLSLHSAHKSLRTIRGDKRWWDGLEWEADSIKSNFLPFFDDQLLF